MNMESSLTETVMRPLLCQSMGLNATYASSGNRPSAMKSFLAVVANTMAAAIKASNMGFGFRCVQIAIEKRHAMAHYHWTVSDFRRRFYKNYLDITED